MSFLKRDLKILSLKDHKDIDADPHSAANLPANDVTGPYITIYKVDKFTLYYPNKE
jgi:hypothetical protein